MDIEEFRQRLDGANARAAVRRLEAVEMLAANVDLRRENGEAFRRQHARQLGEDRHVDEEPDAIQSTDAER
jgi:hypothetical protein